jgi:hypothetical protein
MADLASWIERLDVDCALCTHKDLVKLAVRDLAGRPLQAMLVGLKFFTGQAALEMKMEEILIRNMTAK